MTDSAMNCISENRDLYGYVWMYEHTPDEPEDTMTAAIMIACEVAGMEADKDGKTYIVASTNAPSVAVYALPFGHPMISEKAMNIMFQRAAGGQCIRMPKPKKH
jgi:hypothetical protein